MPNKMSLNTFKYPCIYNSDDENFGKFYRKFTGNRQ